MAPKSVKGSNVPNLRFPGFNDPWIKAKLGDIAEKINSGKTPLGGESNYLTEGVLFVRSQNVNNDRLELENIVYISENVNAGMKNSVVRANDILLNITGASLGRSCVVPEDFEKGNVNQHVCIIRPRKRYNPRFIQPILGSARGQAIFESLQTGSGREGLNFDSIKKIELDFPSLPEQEKIADFLSLIDRRIQTQNKIIQQLETLIKGIGEKLFSQKIRFKEFIGEWELKKLGEVFYSEKGKGLSKDKLTVNGEYECVLYGELYTKYKEVILNVVSKTNEDDGFKSQIGDLLIPSSTTTTGIDLANVTAINKENVLLGGDITVLRSREKINNVFYAYYLSNYKKEEMASYAQGSTIVHLYYSHIKDMAINFPSFEEQNKISQFLLSIDAKIQTEKNLLDKYQSQKQYLLQNLFI